MMKNWKSKALVVAAILTAGFVLGSESAEAQVRGYSLGVGFGYGQSNSVRFISPREDLPYFAKFPPVYYGDMVRRPYGFSPYALPPGILPVESTIAPAGGCAKTIINPYFVPQENQPVSEPVEANQENVEIKAAEPVIESAEGENLGA